MEKKSSEPIVFFDGICGFCNATVACLLKCDTNHVIKFATLQGQTAKRYLPTSDTQNLTSIILLDNDTLYRESDAFLQICKHLGGFWKCLLIFKIIPPLMRNAIYNFIAKHRRKIFGVKETCYVPKEDVRSYFLD